MVYLSQKHGVNPSLYKCFVCGKDAGILLFGKLKGDKEAPFNSGVIGPNHLCHECEKVKEKGIYLFSVKDGCSHEDPYFTGKIWAITEEGFKRSFVGDIVKQALKIRMCFIEDSIAATIGLPNPVNGEN